MFPSYDFILLFQVYIHMITMERTDIVNALKHNVLFVSNDFRENKSICTNTIILTHSQMLEYVKKESIPLTYLQSDNCPGNCKLSCKSSKQPPLTQHVTVFLLSNPSTIALPARTFQLTVSAPQVQRRYFSKSCFLFMVPLFCVWMNFWSGN